MLSFELSPLARRRWSIASRVLAASAGGYAWITISTLALGILAPRIGVARADLVYAASMAGFAIYALLILAVFHTRTATRAWIGLAVASLPPSVVVWVWS